LHTERTLPEGMGLRGATWAESADGIHFIPANQIYDTTRNPSVYNIPGGRFRMFTGYGDDLRMLEADRWPEFKLIRSHILPCGKDSPMKNCLDCPAWFEWHGIHYMLVGFSGMWSSQTPDFRNAVDLAARGEDIYDGLDVPMVAAFQQERRILAGWLPVAGWGGILGIRELVYHPDGVLGIRWMNECMPPHEEYHAIAADGATGANFYLEMEVRPGENLQLHFDGEGEALEFRLDTVLRRAEIAPATRKDVPTKREMARRDLPDEHTPFCGGSSALA